VNTDFVNPDPKKMEPEAIAMMLRLGYVLELKDSNADGWRRSQINFNAYVRIEDMNLNADYRFRHKGDRK
jgi:hypothetical protein